MTGLADPVLPRIRTRAEIWRWSVANEHGDRMQEAADILEAAAVTGDPAEVYAFHHPTDQPARIRRRVTDFESTVVALEDLDIDSARRQVRLSASSTDWGYG